MTEEKAFDVTKFFEDRIGNYYEMMVELSDFEISNGFTMSLKEKELQIENAKRKRIITG